MIAALAILGANLLITTVALVLVARLGGTSDVADADRGAELAEFFPLHNRSNGL